MEDTIKKIAWIVPKTYTTQSRIYKEAKSLSENGYKVVIYSMNQFGVDLPFEKRGVVNIERIKTGLFTAKSLFFDNRIFLLPLYTFRIIVRLFRYKPDIIYCSNLPSVHIGLIGKYLFKSKIVYDSHDLFVEQPQRYKSSGLKRELIMAYEGLASRSVDIVIQTTNGRCAVFERYYGIKPVRIMNKPLMPAIKNKKPSFSAFNIDCQKTIVGYVGSVLPNRGLEQMIEVAANFEEVQVVVLGYASGPWAEDFVRENKKFLTLIPPVKPDEITSVLKGFDIGFSLIQNSGLSYYLSCPTKVFELVASETPQIASDFPEIRKLIIGDGQHPVGIVVDPSDLKAIQNALEQLIISKEKYRFYKSNCKVIAEQCFWPSEEKKLLHSLGSL